MLEDDPARNAEGEEVPSLLFAYGTLGPGHVRGHGHHWEPDAVRGRLYDLGPYPALVGLDEKSAGWVEGHVRAVTSAELVDELDPYESLDAGLFLRTRTRTRAGRLVWVYVWARTLPGSARGPLVRWPG